MSKCSAVARCSSCDLDFQLESKKTSNTQNKHIKFLQHACLFHAVDILVMLHDLFKTTTKIIIKLLRMETVRGTTYIAPVECT